MNLYFVDGGDIPYVALSEYMPLLSEAIETLGTGKISYEVQADENHLFTVKNKNNDALLLLDTKANTMDFTDFNYFLQPENSKTLVTVMDIAEPGEIDISDLTDQYINASTDEEREKIAAEIKLKENGEPDKLFRPDM